MRNPAIEYLKQIQGQYEREVKNLEAQAKGVERAIDLTKAKIEATERCITIVTDQASPLAPASSPR